MQKACACSTGEACTECGSNLGAAMPQVQRFDASSVFPGGDTRGFMAQLRSSVTEMANSELAEVGRTADSCPYIQRWLAHYERSDASHLQRAIQRYAKPGEHSTSGYESSILSRVRGALRVWKSTGQISGIPDEALGPEAAGVPLSSSLGAGQALDSGVRTRLEAAYGSRLDGVRVHPHGAGPAMAQNMSALAFTAGNNIAFAPGMYRPGTPAGDALIAHEVAHTIQQGGVEHSANALDHATESSLEREADAAAAGALAGTHGAPMVKPTMHGGLKLQRCDTPDCTRYPQSGLRLDIQRKRNCGLLDPPMLPPGIGPFPDYRPEDDLGNRPLDPSCYPSHSAPQLAAAGLGGTAVLGKFVQRQVPVPVPVPPPMPPPMLPPIEPLPLPPIEPLPLPPLEPLPLPPVNPAPLPVPPTWPGPYPVVPIPHPPAPGPVPDIREDDQRYLDRLTPEQRDYYRWLREAERLQPEPGENVDDELPDVCPVPVPNPDEGGDEDKDRGCVAYPTRRRGGHAEHDAYATLKSGTIFDWYARSPGGSDINYDGKTPASRTVWEVKVGHGWFFNCDLAGPREARLRQWDAQKNRGMAVAAACGYFHIWACKSRWVAAILQRRWGGIPPVVT